MDLSSLINTSSGAVSTKKPIQKLAPWDSKAPKNDLDKLATQTLNSPSLFSGGLGKGAGSGILDKNDRNLFLVHNATEKLKSLANMAANRSLTDTQIKSITNRINSGIKEINEYVSKNRLTNNGILVAGKNFSTYQSNAIGQSAPTSFKTKELVFGDETAVPDSFSGDVKFSMTVGNGVTSQTINIDLSEMGTTTRTLDNVAAYINGKLSAAGVEARFFREETTTASKITGIAPTKSQAFKITYGANEAVSFNGGLGTTETAVYVSGAKITDKISQSVLTRVDLSDANIATKAFSNEFTATKGLNIHAMTRDDEGNIYTISDVAGEYKGLDVKANTDVSMQKIDSTGRVVWSRIIGSNSDAKGYSIAVDDSGNIALAGSVNGKISNDPNVSGNGLDSFVSMFDSEGRDLWTHQQGSTGTDSALDVKFDGAGNLLVLGKTDESIAGVAALGGNDVYLQSFAADGTVNYTKTLGTSGEDAPIGIRINGADAYVAWNSASGGQISRIDTNTGNFSGADVGSSTQNIEKISAFDIDGSGNVIIAGNKIGQTSTDQLVSFNLNTSNVNFTKDLNGSPVRALNVNGGLVNIALEGVPDPSATNTTVNQSVLKGFAASDGNERYSINVTGEFDKNISITTAELQDTSLQAFGLPQGTLSYDKATNLADLTGIQTGDYFEIAVNNGSKRKITISEGETMQTLATKIGRFTSSYANISVLSRDGGKYFSLTPKPGARLEVFAGAGMANALKQLGLESGSVISTTAISKSTPAPKVIALELPTEFDISDKKSAEKLVSSLDSALRSIRIGYRAVSNDPTMVELRRQQSGAGTKNATNSKAIAAYNAQAAAAQEALYRLGG